MTDLLSKIPQTVNFDGQSLELITVDGTPWVRGGQIAHALGYADSRDVNQLYTRNADEFTGEDTCVLKLRTEGQEREVRVFSPTGCYLIGFFARTEKGKAFRAWAKKVLMAYRTGEAIGKTVPVKAHTRVIKPRGDAKALPAPEKPKDDGNPILEMELFNRIREAEARHTHSDFVHLLTHTVMGMIESFDKLRTTRETYGLVQKIVKKEAA